MGTSYLNPSEDPTWYPSQINKTDSFTEDQYMGKKDKDNDRYNGIENFYSKSPNQNSNKNMYKINSDGKNIVEDNKKNKNTKTSQNKDNNSDKNDGSKDETSWYQI
jgi:hypothetical protein